LAILHGRDIFSSKWTTAEITDASNQLHFFPIKHVIGEYFPVTIDKQLYIFKIDGRRIKTHRPTAAKSFRVLQYNTSHFLPVSAEISELELMLKKNNLPRVDGTLFSIMKILGRKEKGKFEPHEIQKMLEQIADKKDEYSEEVRNMITYLDHLNIDKIVSPVKRLGEFLEGDLLETDPKFYATVQALHERADKGNKIITNAEIGPKVAWMKLMLVFMMIGMIGFVIYYGYDQGWFDSFTSIGEGFQGIGNIIPAPGASFQPPGAKDDAYYQANFTPESLRAAIDRGEIDEDSLPTATKEMVKNVKPPKATPIP